VLRCRESRGLSDWNYPATARRECRPGRLGVRVTVDVSRPYNPVSRGGHVPLDQPRHHLPLTATMFRVGPQGEGIDGAREIVREQPPGRYDVDEIRAEPFPFPSGHTSRSWGRLIRRPDGRVDDEPWPWGS
jgi:hypothetical protein